MEPVRVRGGKTVLRIRETVIFNHSILHKAVDTVTEQDTARQENVSRLYKIEDVEL